MPTRRPRRSNRPPPELPGLIGASIWIIGTPSWLVRPTALTTPAVTVFWRPNGLPIAKTRSPWRRPASGSSASSAPWPTEPWGRRMARSWRGSASTTSAGTSRPSLVTTLTEPPSRMTWLLVTIRPEGASRTPLPWLLPALTCTTEVWTRATASARSASAPSAGAGVVVAAGVSATCGAGEPSPSTSSAVTAPTPPASTSRAGDGGDQAEAAPRDAALGHGGRALGVAAAPLREGGQRPARRRRVERGKAGAALGARGQRRQALAARAGLEGRQAGAHGVRLYRGTAKFGLNGR